MQSLSFLIMLVVMGGMMFWMQRSQRKQQEKRMESLKKLSKGTDVVTIGGLFGTVDEVDTEAGTVVLDVDGVFLTFELAAIKRVITAEPEKAKEDVAVTAIEEN